MSETTEHNTKMSAAAVVLNATELDGLKRKFEEDPEQVQEESLKKQDNRLPVVQTPAFMKHHYSRINIDDVFVSVDKSTERVRVQYKGTDLIVWSPPATTKWCYLNKEGNFMHPKKSWTHQKSGAHLTSQFELFGIPKLYHHQLDFVEFSHKLHEKISRALFHTFGEKAKGLAQKFNEKLIAKGKEALTDEKLEEKGLTIFNNDVSPLLKLADGKNQTIAAKKFTKVNAQIYAYEESLQLPNEGVLRVQDSFQAFQVVARNAEASGTITVEAGVSEQQWKEHDIKQDYNTHRVIMFSKPVELKGKIMLMGEHYTLDAKTRAFRPTNWQDKNSALEAVQPVYWSKSGEQERDPNFAIGNSATVAAQLSLSVTKVPSSGRWYISYSLKGPHLMVFDKGTVFTQVSRASLEDLTRRYEFVTKQNPDGNYKVYVNNVGGSGAYKFAISATIGQYGIRSTKDKFDETEANAKYRGKIILDQPEQEFITKMIADASSYIKADNRLMSSLKAKLHEDCAAMADEDTPEARNEAFEELWSEKFTAPLVENQLKIMMQEFSAIRDASTGTVTAYKPNSFFITQEGEDNETIEEETDNLPPASLVSLVLTPSPYAIDGAGSFGMSFRMALDRKNFRSMEVKLQQASEEDTQIPEYF